jgi:hypothetical protein
VEFLDFSQLLEVAPASVAVMSTFNFDPVFFENRLLRTKALSTARRIVVFMDAGQWRKLLLDDPPTRLLNRRYLVVPVRAPRGVFHPKLHLFARDDGGQVFCGSNNLTRSGCTGNLELLNALPFGGEEDDPAHLRLAQDAFAFFQQSCESAGDELARVARKWLAELGQEMPWLTDGSAEALSHTVSLVHSYQGSVWERITSELIDSPPKRIVIVSPFFDRDASLVKRLCNDWPKCLVEIVAQHETSQLPAKAMKSCGANVHLTVLETPARRLHAKLMAWESSRRAGFLVGSANFTTAAFDGRNVETCLLVRDAGTSIEDLFSEGVSRRRIDFDAFKAGKEEEPAPEAEARGSLWVDSVMLSADGTLRVAYGHDLEPPPQTLRLCLHSFRNEHVHKTIALPRQARGIHSQHLDDDTLKHCRAATVAWIVADTGGETVESGSTWIVQEDLLTHEASGEHRPTATSLIEENGQGLIEMLDRIRETDGEAAMIDYLEKMNVRFQSGRRASRGLGQGLIRRHDPFRPDTALERRRTNPADPTAERLAICRFVDRHERKVLLRHARSGNVNGMANFLDVLKTIVRLVYIKHAEGVLPRNRVVGYLIQHIPMAVQGVETEDDVGPGFLSAVYGNLNDSESIQAACDDERFLAHVFAAFAILQKVRFDPQETSQFGKVATRPRECFASLRNRLREAIGELDLELPTKEEVLEALRAYAMFTEEELAAFRTELPV